MRIRRSSCRLTTAMWREDSPPKGPPVCECTAVSSVGTCSYNFIDSARLSGVLHTMRAWIGYAPT